ncbi:MAG TPA: hypothetical protein VFA26_10400 [Gemmataceae bacterium]|nr:hypothetical protein [Gemmataceae bacterium]
MSACLRTILPTGAWVRALIVPVLVLVATGIDRNLQTDFWHHLARGRAMTERGGLVDADLFTYTVAGQPLRDNNWLTQLLYYRLFQAGGLELVQLANSLVLAAMMSLLVYLCWRASRSLLLSSAVGAFTFFGLWQLLIIRPQTFSLLLFVLLLLVLELAERRHWLLLVPPAILALWANLHGGFPIGLLLIGACLLAAAVEAWRDHGRGMLRDRRLWAMGLCLGASLLATLANPYGWKVYEYVGVTTGSDAVHRLDEWLPTGLGTLTGKVWVASVLLLLVLFALPGRRPRVRDVCLVVAFLPLACGSVRMVAWWLLVAAPVTAGLLADRLPRRYLEAEEPERPTVGAALACGLLLLAAVLSAPSLERFNPVVGTLRPARRTEADLEAVCARLRERGGAGRVFSRFEWGEYLSWALAPDGTVFMDGRIEIYPPEVWARYSAVTRGRADWERLLDGYGVDYLLLDRAGYHHDLLPRVEEAADRWELVAESGDAVLFARRGAGRAVARRDAPAKP